MLDGNSAAERRYSHDLAVSEERFERLRAVVIAVLKDDAEPLIRKAQHDEGLMYAICAYAIDTIYNGGHGKYRGLRKLIIDDAIDEIARVWEE